MRWEYKYERFDIRERKSFIDFLNEQGKDGWDLVEKSVSFSVYLCIFKRLLS